MEEPDTHGAGRNERRRARTPDARPGPVAVPRRGASRPRSDVVRTPRVRAGRARAVLRDSDHRVLLWLGDVLAAAAAVAGALLIRSFTQAGPFDPAHATENAVWFVLIVPWMLLLQPARRPAAMFSPRAAVSAASHAVVTGVLLYVLVFFLAPRDLLPRLFVLYFLLLAFLLTAGWRFAYVRVFTRTSRRTPVGIVGIGAPARLIADVLQTVTPHKRVVAFVSESGAPRGAGRDRPAVVDGDGLERLVAERSVSELVLAHDGKLPPRLIRAVFHARERGVDVARMPAVYERLLNRLPIRHLGDDVMLTAAGNAAGDPFRIAKRAVDVVAGCIGSAACLLLLPVLGPAVWLSLGPPVLYRQQRVGLAGRRFDILKFRTMRHDAERDGPRWASAGDRRASRTGRFLRRLCLDELPQFWNVLKGEMSLVGPRPERPEFVDDLARAIPFYRNRLAVRPGLTGWAQVNYPYGRSLEDAATKLEYDLYYVKHCSLLLDLRIAASTAAAILAPGRR